MLDAEISEHFYSASLTFQLFGTAGHYDSHRRRFHLQGAQLKLMVVPPYLYSKHA